VEKGVRLEDCSGKSGRVLHGSAAGDADRAGPGRYGKKPVVTHGPLIHNPQVIQMLDEKGIGVYRPG
jgi:hypothetical protein